MPCQTAQEKKKIKRRDESRKIAKGKEEKERWRHQTSLEKRLPEYMTFIWSCRAMHLLLDVARVIVGGIAELGSKGLETLLVLRGRAGLGWGEGGR